MIWAFRKSTREVDLKKSIFFSGDFLRQLHLTYINDNQTNFNPDTILVDSGPTLIENDNSKAPTEECDDNYHAFVEGDDDQPLQIDNIKTAINFPKANKTAINEFTFDSLATLVFPKLFPLGLADPTTKVKFENELVNILYIFSNHFIFFSWTIRYI